MSFLGVDGKTFLVVGIANKKSVAWAVAKLLQEEGAHVIYSVRSEKRKEELGELLTNQKVFVCDFENDRPERVLDLPLVFAGVDLGVVNTWLTIYGGTFLPIADKYAL